MNQEAYQITSPLKQDHNYSYDILINNVHKLLYQQQEQKIQIIKVKQTFQRQNSETKGIKQQNTHLKTQLKNLTEDYQYFKSSVRQCLKEHFTKVLNPPPDLHLKMQQFKQEISIQFQLFKQEIYKRQNQSLIKLNEPLFQVNQKIKYLQIISDRINVGINQNKPEINERETINQNIKKLQQDIRNQSRMIQSVKSKLAKSQKEFKFQINQLNQTVKNQQKDSNHLDSWIQYQQQYSNHQPSKQNISRISNRINEELQEEQNNPKNQNSHQIMLRDLRKGRSTSLQFISNICLVTNNQSQIKIFYDNQQLQTPHNIAYSLKTIANSKTKGINFGICPSYLIQKFQSAQLILEKGFFYSSKSGCFHNKGKKASEKIIIQESNTILLTVNLHKSLILFSINGNLKDMIVIPQSFKNQSLFFTIILSQIDQKIQIKKIQNKQQHMI